MSRVAGRAAEVTRAALLDAAGEIVLRDGVSALTLDAVARSAGVSKGGLLYHFASKRDLVEALIARVADVFVASDEMDGTVGEPGRATRAYLRCSLESSGKPGSAEERLAAALFAGMLLEPALLDTARGLWDAWQQDIAGDGIDEVDATIVRLAADGLWLSRALDLAPPDDELTRRVVARLRALAD
jgi:AcrR family transcriptional regulator